MATEIKIVNGGIEYIISYSNCDEYDIMSISAVDKEVGFLMEDLFAGDIELHEAIEKHFEKELMDSQES